MRGRIARLRLPIEKPFDVLPRHPVAFLHAGRDRRTSFRETSQQDSAVKKELHLTAFPKLLQVTRLVRRNVSMGARVGDKLRGLA